jgi:hypothetical protein
MADTKELLNGIFVNNWGLKVTAFVLALLTFFAIHGATNEELTFKVPVVVDVEEGIAILDKNPASVEITFRGSLDDLRRIDPAQLEAQIRPTVTASAGSEKVHIRQGDISGTVGTRVVKIIPNVVDLSFDTEDEQQFSVAKPTTLGKPLKGKVEIDYEPKVVKIRGPHQQLQRMLADNVVIETEPVDVDERVKSFTRSVYVISPSETWVSQIEPAEIQVTVNIVTESISREWTNLTISAIMDLDNTVDVQIEPAVVNLSLHGRPDLVKSIEGDSIKVFVDCTGLKIGKKYELPVNVHLPPATADVTVTVDPAFVDVLLMQPEGINGKEEKTD